MSKQDSNDETETATPTDRAKLDAQRTPEAIEASNNFHAFMRGWRHAAAGRAKDPKHVEHATLAAPYKAGYESGRAAFRTAVDAASERFGHVPSPFREAAQP